VRVALRLTPSSPCLLSTLESKNMMNCFQNLLLTATCGTTTWGQLCSWQGLPLVHSSAQPEHFLWDELGVFSDSRTLHYSSTCHLNMSSLHRMGWVFEVMKTPQNSTKQLRLRWEVDWCQTLATGSSRLSTIPPPPYPPIGEEP